MNSTPFSKIASSFVGIAILLGTCFACTQDNPEPANPITGDITVEIAPDAPDGNGSGTAASPFIATPGDTLDLTIESTSTYTDPNGSVITRSPRAHINLSMSSDTIYAKDLAALTALTTGDPVATSTEEDELKILHTTRSFTVGEQEIAFDCSYEIYRVINSNSETIEMPYLKLNQVALGKAQTDEVEGEAAGKAAVVSHITVKPLPASRATYTTESLYEVEVRFSIKAECVHAQNAENQTLHFTAGYIGVVETEHELQEPQATLSHQWSVKNSATGKSPFMTLPGKTMELSLNQTSTYTDEYGNRLEAHPKAVIKVSVANDTLWGETVEALRQLTPSTDNTPAPDATTLLQQFVTEGQAITIEQAFDVPEAPLPYYQIEPAELQSITLDEDPDALVPGKEADVYTVTARFTQTLTPQGGASDAKAVTVEYIVNYIGAVEVKLVKVDYRKDFAWLPTHDNLPLLSHVIVYRDRTYSNGKTFTDTFTSMNCAIEGGCISMGNNYSHEDMTVEINNGEYIYYKCYPDQIISTDYEIQDFTSTYVPDLSKVQLLYTDTHCTTHEADGTHLEEYLQYGVHYNPENPVEGWYFDDIGHKCTKRLTYDGITFVLRTYNVETGFFDRFLCIDDTIIDFRETNMTREFDIRVVDLAPTEERGPGKIHIMDCKGHYLGRDFYWCVTDTIYEIKK